MPSNLFIVYLQMFFLGYHRKLMLLDQLPLVVLCFLQKFPKYHICVCLLNHLLSFFFLWKKLIMGFFTGQVNFLMLELTVPWIFKADFGSFFVSSLLHLVLIQNSIKRDSPHFMLRFLWNSNASSLTSLLTARDSCKLLESEGRLPYFRITI